MFKLVISDDEGKTTVVPLVRDEITIGRKEGNTIRLTERNVSRRHAKLMKANGAFTIEDLESYNGVKVNGRRIEGQVHLKAGDQLSIGDYLLALQLDAAEVADAQTAAVASPAAGGDAATAMIAAPTEPRPPARLVMLTPPAPGAEFALSRPRQKVGRAEDLAIWVNHRSISREHAEIVRDGDGFRLLDLGSANGVRVNGRDAADAVLEPGDVIELGQVRFRYVAEGETYVFEADRTIQMEALPGPEPVSRAPIYAAIGIILAAVGVAVIVALGGSGGEDEDLTITQIDEPGETSPAPVAQEADADQLTADCHSALARGDFAAAITAARAALDVSSTHGGATGCLREAEAGSTAEGTFSEGRRLWDAGDVEGAVMQFQALPPDSELRRRSPVPEAFSRYADEKLREAERIADSDPEAAHHLIESVRATGLSAAQTRTAEALEARLRRLATATVPTREERNPRGQRNPRGEREATQMVAAATMEQTRQTPPPDNGNALIECAAESNFNRCVIERIPNPRSQRELAAVAQAYYEMGNIGRACQFMRRYIERYNDSRARQFAQLVQARCN
jgi:pSer/pThr/pTyr-binding forkhead associated (FHA) protein